MEIRKGHLMSFFITFHPMPLGTELFGPFNSQDPPALTFQLLGLWLCLAVFMVWALGCFVVVLKLRASRLFNKLFYLLSHLPNPQVSF